MKKRDSGVCAGKSDDSKALRGHHPPALFSQRQKIIFLHNQVHRYLFALAMVGVALLFRFALAPLAETGLQFVTIFPLVIIVAVFAGRWPAVLFSVISSPLAAYYFSRQFDADILASALLVVFTAFISGGVVERLHGEVDTIEESERRFRVAQELSPDGFTILRPIRDEQGHIADFEWVYENETIARWNGTDSAAVVGRRLSEILPSHVGSDFHKLYVDVAESGRPNVLEAPFHGETMTLEKWFRVAVVPIGKDIAILAQDLTDRKNAEATLRERERHFREVADSMPQIVWTARPDGYVDYFNRKWYEITKSDPEKMGEASWGPALHPDDVQKVKLLVAESVSTGKIFYTELRLKMVDTNQYRWYIARALPMHDEQGNITRWYGTATDIHDFKKAHDALDVLKTDLHNKNRELESIIGIVSHDLRAPLVNIKGFSGELKMDYKALGALLAQVPVDQKIKTQLDNLLHRNIPESIQYIETSSEVMNNLVKTLVEVARAGMSPVKPEPIDMNDLAEQVIESIKIKFKEANVHFDLSPLPDCYADPTQVAQIFTNLVDNAVKYLDPSRPGWVCIEGKPQAGGVLYSVSDNGIGIALEQQDKIFDPYYQLKEKASGGVGLGLATVKRMLDRNHGKIWVISEKGNYSTFYVALPQHAHRQI